MRVFSIYNSYKRAIKKHTPTSSANTEDSLSAMITEYLGELVMANPEIK